MKMKIFSFILVTLLSSFSFAVSDSRKEKAEHSVLLAQYYMEKGNYIKAIQNLNDALRNDPDNPTYQYMLAKNYLYNSEYKLATQYFTTVGKYLSSIKFYEKYYVDVNALNDLKMFYLFFYHMALITYIQSNNYTSAEISLSQEIRRNPSFAEAYFLKGCCSIKLKNKEKALAAFKKAVNFDPNFTAAEEKLAEINKTKDFDSVSPCNVNVLLPK